MSRRPVYLDHNATSPTRPEVISAMAAAMEMAGNPSSVHAAGRKAAGLVARARDQVAALASVPASSITFTSGATEANNMAILGAPQGRILYSGVEHDSVIQPAMRSGKRVEYVPVDEHGIIDINSLQSLLESGDEPALVAVMAVNNETGVIQPIADIAQLVHEHGSQLHCDAVQAAGKIDLGLITAMADMVSLSAHKFGGPAGVGALIVRCDDGKRSPLVTGGGQEKGARAGTENVPGIVGFGRAAELAQDDVAHAARLVELRDAFEEAVQDVAPDTVIVGQAAPRVGNVSCLSMPGMLAETQVMAFDLAGFAVSAGSACSSGKIRRSHVLEAMGLDDKVATCAIRVSLGWNSTAEDIGAFLDKWLEIYGQNSGARRQGVA